MENLIWRAFFSLQHRSVAVVDISCVVDVKMCKGPLTMKKQGTSCVPINVVSCTFCIA